MTNSYLLGLELDSDVATPIYRRLRAAIVDAIESGAIAAGDALPSSRSLAERVNVSRSTVNLTYQELVAEGFLVAEERPAEGDGFRPFVDLAAVRREPVVVLGLLDPTSTRSRTALRESSPPRTE